MQHPVQPNVQRAGVLGRHDGVVPQAPSRLEQREQREAGQGQDSQDKSDRGGANLGPHGVMQHHRVLADQCVLHPAQDKAIGLYL